MNNKNIFLWALYDFANSIAAIIFAFYFPQWLVVEKQVADIWFNLLFVGSTVLLILTAPIIAIIGDMLRIRLRLLRILSGATFLSLLGIGIITNFTPAGQVQVVVAALLFMLATYFYLFSFIFYNSFIIQLAPQNRLGFVSGIGQFANWLGQITGLLLALPLTAGRFVLTDGSDRAQAFLPAAVIFILLALPMLLFFQVQEQPKRIALSIRHELRDYITTFHSLIRAPGLGSFLLGYFFYNNALLTASSNFPVYIERIFSVSDQIKTVAVVIILCMAAFGALIAGWFSDRLGLKKSLIIILISWIIVLPLLALQSNFFLFGVLLVITGLLFGASAVISRAVVSSLAPANQSAYTFSYYTITERAASIVGPLLWGGIIFILSPYGDWRYRTALMAMTLFIGVGLFFIKKIPARP